MSVVNGQIANQTTFNNAFMSRTAATTSTLSKVGLLDPDVGNSGNVINNLQKAVNKAFEGVGASGESDAAINNYANQHYITNGDNRKVAVGKLDAQLFLTQTDLDADELVIADHESRIDAAELTIINHEGRLDNLETADMTIGGNKIFSGDILVQGNFEVTGTTTAINSTNLEVEDQNILLNRAGTNLSSEGAGITIERPAGNAGFQFDSTLASKWKIGLVASLYEVLVSGVAQSITGLKTFLSGIKTDTIDESTLNAGVTIETVLIKDGLVDSRDISVDGATLDNHGTRITALESAPAGGGGGGSLIWNRNGTVSPLQENIDGFSFDSFDFESTQEIFAVISVPSTYVSGKPIKLKGAQFFCTAIVGKVFFKTETSLIRSGSVLGTYPNQRVSTNAVVTVNGVSNTINSVGDLDLTSAIGQINAVAVSAGNKLRVRLYRDNAGEAGGAGPALADARLLSESLEMTMV